MKFNNPKTIYKAITFTVGLFLVFLFSFSMAHAQSGSSLWKLSGTNLLPVNSTWNLKIPALNTTGSTKCVNVSSTGQLGVASDDCGTGGGGGISDGDKGDVTVSGSGSIWTIDNLAVTFAKFQNITANRLLGREGTTGSMQEIQLSGRFDLNGGVLDVLGGTPDGNVGTYQFNLDGTSFVGSDVLSTPDDGGTIEAQDKYLYIKDDASPTKRFRFEASGLTAGVDRIITTQDRSGTMALLEDNLGNFANTTSAQLRTVTTDETGTGQAVYATSPTLVTPILGTPTSGTLTNTTGLPLTTGTTGVLPETKGGTNQSTYTTGDILYASASNTLSKLAGVATGNALISGGVSTAPSWGKIGLTTHISGILAGTNGGTGVNNGSNTITLGGNFTTSGANNLTITTTGATNVTVPTSGTLVNDAVTSLGSLGTVDTTLTGPLYATAGVLSTLPTRASVSTFSTTSTSYVDITGLNKTLAINTSYTFRIIGEWTSNNNSGQATIGFVVPAGASATMTRFMGITSSAISASMQNTNNQVATVAIGTANGIRTVMASGIVVMGGTAGNLQIRLASNNASYTATVQNIVLEVTPF